MINWHDTTGTLYGDCAWKDDLVFAELVARKLDIPLHTVDLSYDYRSRVVDYMFAEYEKGRTPNPDVLCNREIKFDIFVDAALKYGAEYVATGHYARKQIIQTNNGEVFRLMAAAQIKTKTKATFFASYRKNNYRKHCFPLGN